MYLAPLPTVAPHDPALPEGHSPQVALGAGGPLGSRSPERHRDKGAYKWPRLLPRVSPLNPQAEWHVCPTAPTAPASSTGRTTSPTGASCTGPLTSTRTSATPSSLTPLGTGRPSAGSGPDTVCPACAPVDVPPSEPVRPSTPGPCRGGGRTPPSSPSPAQGVEWVFGVACGVLPQLQRRRPQLRREAGPPGGPCRGVGPDVCHVVREPVVLDGCPSPASPEPRVSLPRESARG